MKKFLVIGNFNAITYKDVFPLIKDNNMWLGYKSLGCDTFFHIPDDYKDEVVKNKKEGSGWKEINGEIMGRISICWFTNLDNDKRHTPLKLTKTYNSINYQRYDNYNAIEVSKTTDIPMDYKGAMGVPITFLDKYCPEQFEILDAREYALKEELKHKATYLVKDADGSINGKAKYARILIKKTNEKQESTQSKESQER